jgi:hypothetical protein
MNRPTVVAAFLCSLAFAAPPATANDSTAELGAGGLQLVRNFDVRLVSEDLYVSADAVRVTYRFLNTSDTPITSIVAFPLPPIDAVVPEEMNIILPEPAAQNFVGFTVTVDGRPVTPLLEERATALGVDRSDVLRRMGLPLNPIAEGLYQTLEALPADSVGELSRLGLVYVDEYSTQAAWRLEATFYWEQTFPAGREIVVEHTYKPVAGYGFFGEHVLSEPYYVDTFCIDDAFARAARAKLAPLAGTMNPYLDEVRLSYILTTAANWLGTIGTFRLVVDKGSPDALVSFCAEGVRKISPTEFEVTAEDYVPLQDLHILIARPAGGQ